MDYRSIISSPYVVMLACQVSSHLYHGDRQCLRRHGEAMDLAESQESQPGIINNFLCFIISCNVTSGFSWRCIS